jgi:hypothetical protein
LKVTKYGAANSPTKAWDATAVHLTALDGTG